MKLSKKQIAKAIVWAIIIYAILAAVFLIVRWISNYNVYNTTFCVYGILFSALAIVIYQLKIKKSKAYDEGAEALMLMLNVLNAIAFAIVCILKMNGITSEFLSAARDSLQLYLLCQVSMLGYINLKK